MFVLNGFADAMFLLVDCVHGLGRAEPLTSHFFIKVIVELYVISDDGRLQQYQS